MIFKRKTPKNRPSVISKSGWGGDVPQQKHKKDTERRRPVNSGTPVFSYYARGSRINDKDTPARPNALKSNARFLSVRYIPSYLAFTVISTALIYSLYLQPNPKKPLRQRNHHSIEPPRQTPIQAGSQSNLRPSRVTAGV